MTSTASPASPGWPGLLPIPRAYEWSNYRFASAWINSSKQTADDQVLEKARAAGR